MTGAPLNTLAELAARVEALATGDRPFMLAVAGAPGSGKSTTAKALSDRIGKSSCVIPMDGFHLDNETLQAKGLLSRKGAPQTFDLSGFSRLVLALRTRTQHHYPTFDRAADAVVPRGGMVPSETEVLIFEGNYLLLDAPGWTDLAAHWDASVWLDVPTDVLHARLVQRWRDHGLTESAAQTRAEQNDMLNVALVTENRLTPTWVLT